MLIPKENEKDLKDIPATIKKAVKIIAVEHMDEVLGSALAVETDDFLRDGMYDIEDIYEVPGGSPTPPADVPHPTGIN